MLCERRGRQDIDLFASGHKYQLKPFASWYPDPESCSVDVMSMSWENKFFYLFPPFSMIAKILKRQKLFPVEHFDSPILALTSVVSSP